MISFLTLVNVLFLFVITAIQARKGFKTLSNNLIKYKTY